MNLTTKELLYLEDLGKLFESINQTCIHRAQNTDDQQLKAVLQGLSQDHQQWVQILSNIVINNKQIQ
ncbi:MAG TPA: hypothetical protein PKA28_08430 [Methylomusa anaerophila]|uniref:Uncharacterized protein n=1 Tax=Methylomusa anaerophila TaxID=1930071 RepID=A0A348AL58_9FIRM|nr:hypothetical protein [Methylomusa anaerophila]BBB91806.1 hypothetical protein MAMMFC1_02491 [Methylomusa anaerophila]HML88460.1 hypothetical protein [Methylomusa anaerophila]